MRATFTDLKRTDINGGYKLDLASTNTYYPFGMLMPGRNWSNMDPFFVDNDYRYGFQGQEKDDEIKGKGNSINYTYRMHDPRVGRFLSIDPLAAKYPWNSTYAFSENRLLDAVELEGKEAFVIHGTTQEQGEGVFSDAALNQLTRISGNSQAITGFSWEAPLFNNENDRARAANDLANYVYTERKRMIKNGEIKENEHVSLIGYSHGGNVAIQAANLLNDRFGIKINLITVSTPAYNKKFSMQELDGEDPSNPENARGINEHIHISHNDDMVVKNAGGDRVYNNDGTRNYVIKDDDINLTGGILGWWEAHKDLPTHDSFDDFLWHIPPMTIPDNNNP